MLVQSAPISMLQRHFRQAKAVVMLLPRRLATVAGQIDSGDKGRSKVRRTGRVAFAVFVMAILLAIPASAVVLESIGEGRGSPFRAECPGGFLVGFQGRVGAWIDNFKVVCESWGQGKRDAIDPQVGASHGGGPSFGRCPVGSAVKEIHPHDTKGDGPTNVIHSIDFRCVSVTDGRSTDRRFGSTVPAEVRSRGGIGTTFVAELASQACPDREVAIGLHGRSGSFVDAVGLICGPIPAAATPVSPPVATTQPPPPQPQRPPSEQDFTGTWDTKTDKGWSYSITFVQTGREVVGNYVAQDGSKGRIRGRFGAGVMEFTWDQDGGYSGSGQFALAPDANSFSGTYRSNPPEPDGPAILARKLDRGEALMFADSSEGFQAWNAKRSRGGQYQIKAE